MKLVSCFINGSLHTFYVYADKANVLDIICEFIYIDSRISCPNLLKIYM